MTTTFQIVVLIQTLLIMGGTVSGHDSFKVPRSISSFAKYLLGGNFLSDQPLVNRQQAQASNVAGNNNQPTAGFIQNQNYNQQSPTLPPLNFGHQSNYQPQQNQNGFHNNYNNNPSQNNNNFNSNQNNNNYNQNNNFNSNSNQNGLNSQYNNNYISPSPGGPYNQHNQFNSDYNNFNNPSTSSNTNSPQNGVHPNRQPLIARPPPKRKQRKSPPRQLSSSSSSSSSFPESSTKKWVGVGTTDMMEMYPMNDNLFGKLSSYIKSFLPSMKFGDDMNDSYMNNPILVHDLSGGRRQSF